MIFGIVSVCIVIIYILFVVFNFFEGFFDGFIALLVGGIGSLFLFLMAYGGLYLIQLSNAEKVTEIVQTEQLSALNTSDKTSGRFFLGSGTIDSNPVVRYMIKDSEGGFQIQTKDFSTSKVYEIPDGVDPRMECSQEFLLPHWSLDIKQPLGDSTCKFYVPKGSVIEDYEISVG